MQIVLLATIARLAHQACMGWLGHIDAVCHTVTIASMTASCVQDGSLAEQADQNVASVNDKKTVVCDW